MRGIPILERKEEKTKEEKTTEEKTKEEKTKEEKTKEEKTKEDQGGEDQGGEDQGRDNQIVLDFDDGMGESEPGEEVGCRRSARNRKLKRIFTYNKFGIPDLNC